MQNIALAEAQDDADWALRSQIWIEEASKIGAKRKRRDRRSNPLVLCGHGVSLRVENGTLVIRDGFTHHPQQQATCRFFPGDLELPERIILLDGSGTLSFDVLSWLAEQRVALARVKWSGEVAIVASGSGYAADRDKVRWQEQTRSDPKLRHAFATDLIRRKLEGGIATLETAIPVSAARNAVIDRSKSGLERLKRAKASDMNTIYAVEGECAKAYFAAWKAVAMRWTGTDRRPIPDDWRTYLSRSSLTSGKIAKNRMASHPLNAMLNYAYTVRQSQLHIQAVADGYDPSIGIMHNAHQGSAAFILDIIEPERPEVDAAILAFVAERTFSAADFIIRSDGVCRLSPQLARMIATLISPRKI